MAEPYWSIGQLAAKVGLTVRTLRYYDAVGLLRPAGRTAAGHRRYTAANVRHLYQVSALRQLGFNLQQIGAALAGAGVCLETIVSQHLQEVEQRIAVETALRANLRLALSALRYAEQPSTEVLFKVMEHMTMLERYLTPDQIDRLKEHHARLGDEAMASAVQQRAALLRELETARVAGEEPGSPHIQALQRRFMELHQQFLGDDAELLRSLQTLIASEGIEVASRGMVSKELHAYLGAAGAQEHEPE